MAEMDSWNDKLLQRLDIAGRLHADLEEEVSASFPQLASLAEVIKRDHPELAERIDLVIGNSMVRSARMPEMLTRLFLAQTQEPPEVIEGEVVEDELEDEDGEEMEVHDE